MNEDYELGQCEFGRHMRNFKEIGSIVIGHQSDEKRNIYGCLSSFLIFDDRMDCMGLRSLYKTFKQGVIQRIPEQLVQMHNIGIHNLDISQISIQNYQSAFQYIRPQERESISLRAELKGCMFIDVRARVDRFPPRYPLRCVDRPAAAPPSLWFACPAGRANLLVIQMVSFTNTILQIGNIDIFYFVIEKIIALHGQRALTSSQAEEIVVKVVKLIKQLRKQSFKTRKFVNKQQLYQVKNKAMLSKVDQQYETTENYEIDIFLTEQNGFWILALLIRRFIKRVQGCSDQLIDQILRFAKSFIDKKALNEPNSSYDSNVGDSKEYAKYAQLVLNSEQVELAYLGFISIICNFDIWCQLKKKKQARIIDCIKAVLEENKESILRKCLQNCKIHYFLHVLDHYCTQEKVGAASQLHASNQECDEPIRKPKNSALLKPEQTQRQSLSLIESSSSHGKLLQKRVFIRGKIYEVVELMLRNMFYSKKQACSANQPLVLDKDDEQLLVSNLNCVFDAYTYCVYNDSFHDEEKELRSLEFLQLLEKVYGFEGPASARLFDDAELRVVYRELFKSFEGKMLVLLQQQLENKEVNKSVRLQINSCVVSLVQTIYRYYLLHYLQQDKSRALFHSLQLLLVTQSYWVTDYSQQAFDQVLAFYGELIAASGDTSQNPFSAPSVYFRFLAGVLLKVSAAQKAKIFELINAHLGQVDEPSYNVAYIESLLQDDTLLYVLYKFSGMELCGIEAQLKQFFYKIFFHLFLQKSEGFFAGVLRRFWFGS